MKDRRKSFKSTLFQNFRLVGLGLILSIGMGSVTKAGRIDCTKATTETEIAICNDPELSALDELLGIAWEKSKKQVTVENQKRWMEGRDQCDNKVCLREEMGVRIGTLLAISDGLEERIKQTPFRYIEPKDVFVRCRRNYQGSDVVQYVEILFSFEQDGPTFKETNISLNGTFSESIWDWLVWSAVASDKQIVQHKGGQSILERGFPVTKEYVLGLQSGKFWAWIIHEDPNKGASFTSFWFETTNVKKCLSYIE